MSNFYITTSIPYVNSDPHIGFGMELVLADILARYMRQHKTPTLFATGTDEHGGKIAEKAAELKVPPKEFADQVSKKFQELLKTLNISNDRFIRTTDPVHEQRAQLIWKKLEPHIYKGKYSGWYCTGDEAFFSEQVVKTNKGVCPAHNRPYEKLEEENYFFKLSTFNGPLKKLIESDELRILPVSRKHEIMAVINTGLEDISISRPKNKIEWGIPVPNDDSQVMYVWFEALMNYLTVLGYPEHSDFKKFWPANVQVIGKDILRFHAAVWPAMLLGLSLPVQKTLYVHGFVNVGGKKMSKTLGNVVAPADIVSKYGIDTFRYFFARHIPSADDGDFTWDRLEAAYNDELADQLGNAVSRTAAMISKYQNGLIGDIPEPGHDIEQYQQAIADCQFDRALDKVWEQVKGLNQYIEEAKPWEIAKSKDDNHLREVLAYQAACLLEIASLLAPFMPETANKIQTSFGSGVLKPLSTSLSETRKNRVGLRSTMEFIDSHCHPQFTDYDNDREQVLGQSAQAGVTRLIAVGCSLEDSRRAADFAKANTGIWASAGVHPHDGANFAADSQAPAKLRSLLDQPKVVAVGEIGLDYYHDRTPKNVQEKVLRTQIEIGLEAGLPIIFHVREAWSGFWPVFDSYKNVRGVIHSFSAPPDQLDEVLSRGLYIGLSGLITYTQQDSWRESARRAPLDKVLLETDAPFLTPIPFRGQRCTPAHTRTTAEFLAQLRGETLQAIAARTTKNSVELFSLDGQKLAQ